MSNIIESKTVCYFSNKSKQQKPKLFNLYQAMFNNIQFNDIKTKFEIFNYIINNTLLLDTDKETLIDIFCNNQKNYHKLNNIIYKYKLNKSTFYDNIDCGFDQLDDIDDKFIICIFCNGVKYNFKKSDIINIIKRSILCCPDMFVEPNDIKNPWTNIPFSLADLYNIYFALKETDNVPFIYELYFKCNFNKNKLVSNYESVLLDEYLKKYIDDLSFHTKYTLTKELIIKYKKFNKILREFKVLKSYYSKEKLVEKFKPLLKKYLIIKYSMNSSLKFNCERELIRDFTILVQMNLDFKPNSKYKNKVYSCQQIIFESLKHLNKFSLNKKKELIFKNSEGLFVFSNEPTDFKFTIPNIKTKVSGEFIKLNKINVQNDNINRILRQGQRFTYFNDHARTLRNVRARTPSLNNYTDSLRVTGTSIGRTLENNSGPNYIVDNTNVIHTISDILGNINWESHIMNAFANRNITNIEVNISDIISGNSQNTSEITFYDNIYDRYIDSSNNEREYTISFDDVHHVDEHDYDDVELQDEDDDGYDSF